MSLALQIDNAGLATCIELCVKALRLESSENADVKISLCKTISCLLPDDLEVKRACQLSEFLLEPTVGAYYAVEMLYNQPDQKYDEENIPIPNALRCELLLVLKAQWPFDPEFWDWKTLKRQCLALMGEEASIVSSVDELNDSEVYEKLEDCQEETKEASMNGLAGTFDEATSVLSDIGDEKQKKRETKKLRESGFISARFRNWQAYMQYCVLCDKEFLGHRIVRHAQKHYKDGIYSCPICAEKFDSKENFFPHVTLHVKNSSKERLAAMKPLKRLERPPKIATANENQKTHPVSKQEQRPIKKSSLYSTDFIVFNDNNGCSDDENNDKDKPYVPDIVPVQKPLPVNEFTCPVSFCKKGFKYFKNLIAHAKGHKDNEEAKRFLEMQSRKVICRYCRRHFVSVTHLNDHFQMHCGSKPYICIQMKCKAGFSSYAELLTHRKEHQVFRAECMFPKCGRVFSEAYLLYDHEAQHYNTFTCKVTSCGKVYHSQNELEKHVEDHSKQPEVMQQPEVVQQPESQTNQPDLRQHANANPTGSSQVQHVSSALFPSHLENLANPMLPSVGSVINPSLSAPIKSEPESVLCSQMENLSGATLPSQLDDLAKKVMPLNIDSGSDPFLPLPAENGPMPLFPSTAENPLNSLFSQVENNTNNFSLQLEGNGSSALTKEDTVVQLFPSRLGNESDFIETSSQDPASEKVKKDRIRNLNGKERKPKHKKRAKWPAIIRDGKFICSGCFRVFTNPRSLGGHLSKRSYCKPLEGSEISAEALQASGQSRLASMILSSNSLNLQKPQESAFNPETCFKDPSFLQLLAAENHSTALLKTVFPRAPVTSFNTSGNEEGNQIIKRALETAGIPSTFDNTEVLPHVVPTSCITATTQINAAVLPNSTTSPLVQPACNPSTLLTDQNRTLNTKPREIVCRRLPVFAKGDPKLSRFEVDFYPGLFSDPVPAEENIAADSSQVSAISSPTDPGSSNTNKEGTSASKKKKKETVPLLAPKTSPKVAVNNTVVGLLNKSTEENVQMQGEVFQSNLLASCGSQVVENLTQKLNNVGNKPFVCQDPGCSYSAMRKDALFKHYGKIHQYTAEMILEIKKHQLKYAPFKCVVAACPKTFTRNSNLRAHCQLVHHFTTEEMVKLNYGRRSQNETVNTAPRPVEIKTLHPLTIGTKTAAPLVKEAQTKEVRQPVIVLEKLLPENIPERLEKPPQVISVLPEKRVLKNRSGKECNRLSGKTKLKQNLNLDNKNLKGIQVEENQGYSLKCGKHVYSIKARNDALLECTSRFITLYPCMIKGCSSVVSSESNIIRHYKCHKLSKAFTSQHRNLLIVSKKLSVLPVREDTCEQEETDKKRDVKEPEPSLIVSNNDSSTNTLPQKETEKGEKDEVDELTELLITKPINEDCSSAENQAKISSSVNSDLPETNSCPSEKQKINLKRANKEKNVFQSKRRKVEKAEEVPPADVSSTHREEETAVAIQTAKEQPAAFDWSSFKPMGFEASFLKFLEESAVKLKKTTERDCHSAGTKKGSRSNARKHNEKTSVASKNVTWSYSENKTLIPFANPSQLPCGDNVKIVLDKTYVRTVLEKTFKDCTECMLRQLQEMKPVVTLRKTEGHWEDNPEVLAAEVTVKGPKEGESKY